MKIMTATDVERALNYATDMHQGQIRKYTGEPYISHPINVATTVANVPGATNEMIAAAYMHDVVEDTAATIEDVLNQFGVPTASYVLWLTNLSHKLHGPRRVRKDLDRLILSHAPREVQTIKLADLIDNTSSIVEHDPKFARIYLDEKIVLLNYMDRGDPDLYKRALAQVREGRKEAEKYFILKEMEKENGSITDREPDKAGM